MTDQLTIPLPQRLHEKADMIQMGERIAWGSDSEIMREAADALDATLQREAKLREVLTCYADRETDWWMARDILEELYPNE